MNSLIRLLYLVDSLNVGGTESQLVEVVRRIDRSRYEVTVGCLRKAGPLLTRLEETGIPIVEFATGSGLLSVEGCLQFARLVRYIRHNRFHIVHTQDLWTNLMGIPAAWLARTPVIISSRRDLGNWWWYTPLRRKILRFAQRFSTAVMANSHAVRGMLIEEGFDPSKITVILNAVDTELFDSGSRNGSRHFPGPAPGCPVILFVGNMHDAAKGHIHLIEAAPAVCKQVPQAAFALIGDGKERPRLEARVSALGLKDKFHFLGRRSEIPELLQCASLLVLPSDAEGLPNALLEGMAVGLPVVATAVGGIREIIKDGYTGLLVPPKDPDALARAIVRLLRDPGVAGQLGKNAQEQVRQQFSFNRLLSQLDGFYCALLQQRLGNFDTRPPH